MYILILKFSSDTWVNSISVNESQDYALFYTFEKYNWSFSKFFKIIWISDLKNKWKWKVKCNYLRYLNFLLVKKKSLLKITSFCSFSAKNIWSLFVQFKLIWHHFLFVFHFKTRKRSVTTHPIKLLQFCTMLAKLKSPFGCQYHTYWNTHLMF